MENDRDELSYRMLQFLPAGAIMHGNLSGLTALRMLMPRTSDMALTAQFPLVLITQNKVRFRD